MDIRLMVILPLVIAALLAAGCNKEKDVVEPAELVEFQPALKTSRVWSANASGGDDVLRLGLRPAVADGHAFIAGHGGDVRALELGTGRELWRVDAKLAFSGGPAAGDGVVVAGSSEGMLIALDAGTGAERWRASVGGEVLAAPVVAQGLVVVRTVDGRLRGLRVEDGKEAWVYEQPVPRLTLRGNGAPVVSGDMVIAGFDNGKVVALALETGELLWNTTVAPSKGKTEIERLVDIDSQVRVSGQDVFVVGYQGRIAMLALESGQIWWGRDLSSHRGLAADDSYLYVTAADSTVVALRRRDGTEIWRQDKLLNRSLTGPALAGNVIVVGDFDGYVHWLDTVTGDLLARAKSGGRITNAPVAAGDLLLFQTDSGNVEAWRAEPRSAG
jgi:outer membrane protein assembly factor BamB